MDIAVCKKEIIKGVTTHLELGPSSMLSALANLTPYSDFNQSPRNMYQCQVLFKKNVYKILITVIG